MFEWIYAYRQSIRRVHVHLLGLRAACFTGETVDVCVAVVCVRHGNQSGVHDVCMQACALAYLFAAGNSN